VILLDTSVLIEMLGAGGRMRTDLRRAIERGERLALPTLVLFEWLQGPRTSGELDAQEALLPGDQAIVFGTGEARLAAELYRTLPRARGREIDLAIAACALSWDASIWTLNPEDFADVPGLEVRAG
jgi:predicted nucleic acid-binding protein